MKKCPLCGANCFDDMDTCYCCMHRFGEPEDESGGVAQDEVSQAHVEGECEETPDTGAAAARTGTPGDQKSARVPPVLAFGPTVERLAGVGECVRIDVPLRGLIAMIAAARAAACEDAPIDLPPAA